MSDVIYAQNGFPIIRPSLTRLDAAHAQDLKRECLDAARGDRLVIDLSDVEFIDSTGLGALVAVLKHLGIEGEVGLVTETPGILVVLRITRLNTIFKVFSNRAQAMAWLGSQPSTTT